MLSWNNVPFIKARFFITQRKTFKQLFFTPCYSGLCWIRAHTMYSPLLRQTHFVKFNLKRIQWNILYVASINWAFSKYFSGRNKTEDSWLSWRELDCFVSFSGEMKENVRNFLSGVDGIIVSSIESKRNIKVFLS